MLRRVARRGDAFRFMHGGTRRCDERRSERFRDTELFLAFPLEAAFAVRMGVVGWELGASALVLSPPNEFQVEGLGPAYSPAPIAGMFALRAVLEPR